MTVVRTVNPSDKHGRTDCQSVSRTRPLCGLAGFFRRRFGPSQRTDRNVFREPEAVAGDLAAEFVLPANDALLLAPPAFHRSRRNFRFRLRADRADSVGGGVSWGRRRDSNRKIAGDPPVRSSGRRRISRKCRGISSFRRYPPRGASRRTRRTVASSTAAPFRRDASRAWRRGLGLSRSGPLKCMNSSGSPLTL